MSKYTPWFRRDDSPVRTGWYEVRGGFLHNGTGKDDGKEITTTFRYYDCESKHWAWESPIRGFCIAAFGTQDEWRGLTKETK